MKNKRFKHRIIPIILLIIASILGLFKALLNESLPPGPTLADRGLIVSFVLLELFLIYKIYKRKNWALSLYLILFFIEILSNLGNIIFWFSTNKPLAEVWVLEKILALMGILFLFKKDLYKKIKKPKKLLARLKTAIKKENLKNFILFALLALFLISIYLLVNYINPEEMVNKLGVQNGYILGLVVSFFGGLSAVGAAAFYSVLITLTAGGLNPLLLGLVAGFSLSLGDLLIFYFGKKGRELVSSKWDKKIKDLARLFKKNKLLKKLVPIIAYLYVGFLPLPNDILLLFLATLEYSPKKTNIIIILGDYSFVFGLIFLTLQGIKIYP
ncbi:MAG: hypothetical protein GF347_00990 [Candidatus Moranbacteria bacterium]|nr:hypothetical protein [Candidatus Moranbacteria bacterium]